ncbi:MAG: CBS domain-containing protein [Bacteroidetes bacterium]|nr:MAG: CBS domain-containing protein [Bacteroidota bacterium]
MLAYELITEEVPSLKPTDTGKKVLDWMEDFRISHLPIVDKREFLGLVSYTDMLDHNDGKKTIDKLKISMIKAFVRDSYHIFDVLKVISTYNVSAVAVLDENNKYVGVITADSIIQKIARMPFVNEPGGIIILEINIRDYSLSQIAQIVEGNDAKILNLYVNSHPDTTKMEVTLKVNKDDLAPILQTFARYNYIVKATFYQSQIGGDLKNRFDEFMHFLNI